MEVGYPRKLYAYERWAHMDLNWVQWQENIASYSTGLQCLYCKREPVQWLPSACILPTSFDLLTQQIMNEGEILFSKSRKHTPQNKPSSQVHKIAKETA